MSATTRVTVAPCGRCGGNHRDLAFEPLNAPPAGYTHWAPCPATGQPLLVRHTRRSATMANELVGDALAQAFAAEVLGGAELDNEAWPGVAWRSLGPGRWLQGSASWHQAGTYEDGVWHMWGEGPTPQVAVLRAALAYHRHEEGGGW